MSTLPPFRLRRLIVGVVVAVGLLAVGVAACGDDPPPVSTSDNDSNGDNSNDDSGDNDSQFEPEPVGEQCDDDQELCDGECIDVDSDPRHCGQCATNCPEGHLCEDGMCISHDGNCPATPCTGHTYCDGSGLCRPGCHSDHQCTGGQVCDTDANTCQCPDGQRLCGGACFDDNDPAACGSECLICPDGGGTGTAQCIDGQCQLSCDDGERICDNMCTDCPDHATDTECISGQCFATECSGDRRVCDGTCASCPDGALEYDCDGTQCVATACPGDQVLCNGHCASCPDAPNTTCDGTQCVAASCPGNSFECPEYGCCQWQSSSTGGPDGKRLSNVFIDGDTPNIAYLDIGGELVHGLRESGSWEFTEIDASGTSSSTPGMAVDSLSALIYHRDSDSIDLYFDDGTDWPFLGSTDTDDSTSEIGVGVADDRPYLIYIDDNEELAIYWGAPFDEKTVIDDTIAESVHVEAVTDAEDDIHVVMLTDGSLGHADVMYATNRSGSWQTEELGSAANPVSQDEWRNASIDVDDEPSIAYADRTFDLDDTLEYREFDGNNWSNSTTIDSGSEIREVSMQFDADSTPHIMYWVDHQLHYAYRYNDQWLTTPVDGISADDDDDDFPEVSLFFADDELTGLVINDNQLVELHLEAAN